MSFFGKILAKIFPKDHPATQGTPTAPTATAGTAPTAPVVAAGTTAPPPVVAAAPVDVDAVLTKIAAGNPGPANWKTSIVDLLKLLELDSDLASRKELAHELGYTGSTDDSAAMNIWLHKEVMRKLQENGGQVPASLKD